MTEEIKPSKQRRYIKRASVLLTLAEELTKPTHVQIVGFRGRTVAHLRKRFNVSKATVYRLETAGFGIRCHRGVSISWRSAWLGSLCAEPVLRAYSIVLMKRLEKHPISPADTTKCHARRALTRAFPRASRMRLGGFSKGNSR